MMGPGLVCSPLVQARELINQPWALCMTWPSLVLVHCWACPILARAQWSRVQQKRQRLARLLVRLIDVGSIHHELRQMASVLNVQAKVLDKLRAEKLLLLQPGTLIVDDRDGDRSLTSVLQRVC